MISKEWRIRSVYTRFFIKIFRQKKNWKLYCCNSSLNDKLLTFRLVVLGLFLGHPLWEELWESQIQRQTQQEDGTKQIWAYFLQANIITVEVNSIKGRFSYLHFYYDQLRVFNPNFSETRRTSMHFIQISKSSDPFSEITSAGPENRNKGIMGNKGNVLPFRRISVWACFCEILLFSILRFA